LLLGSDVFNHVHHWDGFMRLCDAVQLVVGYRTGENALAAHPGLAHHAVTTPLADVSSQAIRAGGPAQLQHLVPDPVARYIAVNGLYA
jgi:nicotinic acid mononucleotide adenylyltransferase